MLPPHGAWATEATAIVVYVYPRRRLAGKSAEYFIKLFLAIFQFCHVFIMTCGAGRICNNFCLSCALPERSMTLCRIFFGYADFINCGNHDVTPTVPAQN